MIYFTKFKSIYGNEIVLIYQINDELIVPSSSSSVQFQNYCRYIPKYWSPNHSKSKSSQVTFEKLIWMEEVDQNDDDDAEDTNDSYGSYDYHSDDSEIYIYQDRYI